VYILQGDGEGVGVAPVLVMTCHSVFGFFFGRGGGYGWSGWRGCVGVMEYGENLGVDG
jgi:hypothetical protein